MLDEKILDQIRDSGAFPIASIDDGVYARKLSGTIRNIWGSQKFRVAIFMSDTNDILSGKQQACIADGDYGIDPKNTHIMYYEIGELITGISKSDLSFMEALFLPTRCVSPDLADRFEELKGLVNKELGDAANSHILSQMHSSYNREFLPPEYRLAQQAAYAQTGHVLTRETEILGVMRGAKWNNLLQFNAHHTMQAEAFHRQLFIFLTSLRRELL